MKFTAGYLLGATTVVGIIGSFVAGVIAMDVVYDKKKEAIDKADAMTLSDMMKSYIQAKQN
jgi:uncharacterized membrane protein YeaQ/YmgE (transglycosylase-associated protein family)